MGAAAHGSSASLARGRVQHVRSRHPQAGSALVNASAADRAFAIAEMLYVASASGPLLMQYDGAIGHGRTHGKPVPAEQVCAMLDAAHDAALDTISAQHELLRAAGMQVGHLALSEQLQEIMADHQVRAAMCCRHQLSA